MKTVEKLPGLVLAVFIFVVASLFPQQGKAEPLLVIFQFDQGDYADSATTNEIVVKITRVDQDPNTEGEGFTVDCTLTGTAVENQDYRLGLNWPASGLWRINFPAGVHEQSFSVYTLKKPGPSKTLQFTLSNPSGAAPTVIGANFIANITFANSSAAAR